MSAIDEVLQANAAYAAQFAWGDLPAPPTRRLIVLACMDARIVVSQILGLKPGEAHVLRNAGGLVTEDVLRSLLISHYLLGTREFMIMAHTDCGMMTFTDDDLFRRLRHETGTAVVTPTRFFAFRDLEENVREQVQKVRSHPWIPATISVRGFIYDVKTGRLREVSA
ncbi:Beta-carbonic anhydrase 1 [bacterium HR08]|nr:Beta-carbonic anhydrase 1 [bacterium HR08]